MLKCQINTDGSKCSICNIILHKGGLTMVNFYVYRVTHSKKLWTAVPKLWQDDVKAKLIEEGYTLNDDGTVSKSDQINYGGDLI